MTAIVIHYGPMTAKVKHLKLRRGVYWYVRKVPADLVPAIGSSYLQRSLQTRDLQTALRSLKQLHADTELHWARTRHTQGLSEAIQQSSLNTIDVLKALGLRTEDALPAEGPAKLATATSSLTPVLSGPQILFSEARDLYLHQHTKGSEKGFKRVPLIASDLFIKCLGDISISQISRQNVNQLRDYMLAIGHTTSTVRRRLGVLSVITQTAIDEHGLGVVNPFSKVRIPREGHDKIPRKPFTHEEMGLLSMLCCEANDTPRHIIGMLINTGARLGEIVGLRCTDLKLDAQVPHISITDAERSLKTAASIREVPLIGVSLLSASEALKAAGEVEWLFPQYVQNSVVNTNSASQTINKWLRNKTKSEKTTHSFRHSMADRMRGAQIPEDVQKAICGWGANSVNRQYGNGYSLEVLLENMMRLKVY